MDDNDHRYNSAEAGSESGQNTEDANASPRKAKAGSREHSPKRGLPATDPRRCTSKVVLSSLTLNVNEKHLREICGQFGEIIEVTLVPTSDEKTQKAIVEFQARTEAQDAVDYMHRMTIDNATVLCCFTVDSDPLVAVSLSAWGQPSEPTTEGGNAERPAKEGRARGRRGGAGRPEKEERRRRDDNGGGERRSHGHHGHRNGGGDRYDMPYRDRDAPPRDYRGGGGGGYRDGGYRDDRDRGRGGGSGGDRGRYDSRGGDYHDRRSDGGSYQNRGYDGYRGGGGGGGGGGYRDARDGPRDGPRDGYRGGGYGQRPYDREDASSSTSGGGNRSADGYGRGGFAARENRDDYDGRARSPSDHGATGSSFDDSRGGNRDNWNNGGRRGGFEDRGSYGGRPRSPRRYDQPPEAKRFAPYR